MADQAAQGPGNSNGPSLWRTLGQLGTMGIAMVAAVAIGLGMGYWLDRWLGTTPWLTMLFALFGIVAGFLNMVRDVRRFGR